MDIKQHAALLEFIEKEYPDQPIAKNLTISQLYTANVFQLFEMDHLLRVVELRLISNSLNLGNRILDYGDVDSNDDLVELKQELVNQSTLAMSRSMLSNLVSSQIMKLLTKEPEPEQEGTDND